MSKSCTVVSAKWVLLYWLWNTVDKWCWRFVSSFHQIIWLFLITLQILSHFPCAPCVWQSAHLALHTALQIVRAAKPSAAKASVWSGPLLQGWPASHPAMHLSTLLHLCHHTHPMMKAACTPYSSLKWPDCWPMLRCYKCCNAVYTLRLKIPWKQPWQMPGLQQSGWLMHDAV